MPIKKLVEEVQELLNHCISQLLIADGFRSLSHVEKRSVLALRAIKIILEDDRLDDFECIEKIVLLFESLDMDAGGRHDF